MTESEIKYAMGLLGKLMLHLWEQESRHNSLQTAFKVKETGRCYRVTSTITAISPAEFELEQANESNEYHGKVVV